MRIPATWREVILGLSLPAGVMCALAPTAAWWWPGELACHWGAQGAVLLLPAVALWAKRPRVSGMLMALVLAGAAPTFLAAWGPRATVPGEGAGLVVASGNLFVYASPESRAAGVKALEAGDPGIIALAETIESEDRPRVDATRWPFQVWQPPGGRKFRDSVALLSRHPILSHEILDPEVQPLLVATLDVQGRLLHVLVVHTASPVSPAHTRYRNANYDLIATTARRLAATGPVLLLGDFNGSPASPAWDILAGAGILRPLREPATWVSLIGPLGIPIDHVLGIGLAIASPEAVTLPGSDHRGLITRVAW